MREKRYTISAGMGATPVYVIFSDLAHQADVSLLIQQGDTTVHVAVTLGAQERPELDFVPLTVDYEERFYARGAILGSPFVRRETKPSDEAVVTARMIDRALRPLFPEHFRRDVQVVALVLALDEAHEPGKLALLGASIALSVSQIPWNGPLSVVQVSHKESVTTFDPSATQAESGGLFLTAAYAQEGFLMLEGEGSEIPEKTAEKIFAEVENAAKLQLAEIGTILKKEATPKLETPLTEYPTVLLELFKNLYSGRLETILREKRPLVLKESLDSLKNEFLRNSEVKLGKAGVGLAIALWEESVRALIEKHTSSGTRIDGRAANEIRPLSAKSGGISKILHGSGTFYRGDTHVVSFLTLGADSEGLLVNGMEKQGEKHFIHQYNFPPYASGETGRLMPNRRSIGHGSLAEKALRAILPSRTSFPRTIRLVSEVFASNGSTSMASICAGSLALRNGAVPSTGHVAGVAMGLISHKSGALILTDIQGIEDHYGEMDFKIAGTRKGVTALQLDVKNRGISRGTVLQTLEEARRALDTILDTLERADK